MTFFTKNYLSTENPANLYKHLALLKFSILREVSGKSGRHCEYIMVTLLTFYETD